MAKSQASDTLNKLLKSSSSGVKRAATSAGKGFVGAQATQGPDQLVDAALKRLEKLQSMEKHLTKGQYTSALKDLTEDYTKVAGISDGSIIPDRMDIDDIGRSAMRDGEVDRTGTPKKPSNVFNKPADPEVRPVKSVKVSGETYTPKASTNAGAKVSSSTPGVLAGHYADPEMNIEMRERLLPPDAGGSYGKRHNIRKVPDPLLHNPGTGRFDNRLNGGMTRPSPAGLLTESVDVAPRGGVSDLGDTKIKAPESARTRPGNPRNLWKEGIPEAKSGFVSPLGNPTILAKGVGEAGEVTEGLLSKIKKSVKSINPKYLGKFAGKAGKGLGLGAGLMMLDYMKPDNAVAASREGGYGILSDMGLDVQGGIDEIENPWLQGAAGLLDGLVIDPMATVVGAPGVIMDGVLSDLDMMDEAKENRRRNVKKLKRGNAMEGRFSG